MKRFLRPALGMKLVPALACVCVLVTGCTPVRREPHEVDSASEGAVPYLVSKRTVAEAETFLHEGIEIKECVDFFSSIPMFTMKWTSYALKDGSVVLYYSDGRLKKWRLESSAKEIKDTTPAPVVCPGAPKPT